MAPRRVKLRSRIPARTTLNDSLSQSILPGRYCPEDAKAKRDAVQQVERFRLADIARTGTCRLDRMDFLALARDWRKKGHYSGGNVR